MIDASTAVRFESGQLVVHINQILRQSLRLLQSHCSHSTANWYTIGPLNDISLVYASPLLPKHLRLPHQTIDYIQLLAYNGRPTRRSDTDLPTREKCVELFESIYRLYSQSSVFGPDADRTNFRFSHTVMIYMDPRTGAITGIIDWGAATFRPLWGEVYGVRWLGEDPQRFTFGSDDLEFLKTIITLRMSSCERSSVRNPTRGIPIFLHLFLVALNCALL